MTSKLTRHDVIGFIELYRATSRNDGDRELLDGLIKYVELKFDQHALEYRYAKDQGSLSGPRTV